MTNIRSRRSETSLQQSDTGTRSPKRKVPAPRALRFVHTDYTTSEHSGRLSKRRRLEVRWILANLNGADYATCRTRRTFLSR